jgi:large subunit ribosomal protein L17
MRHRNYGRKLSRNTSHRRALLRNLVTSLILEERIETTLPKAKAVKPWVERVITLGKRGDAHARRLAAGFFLPGSKVVSGKRTSPVQKLFDDVAKRYRDRKGGYTRIVRTGWRKGDGAETAVLELIGTQVLERRAEIRARKAEARRKAAEEAAKQQPGPPPEEGEEKEDKK